MKINLFLGLALILLVQAPFVYSFDCNEVSPENYDTCIEIINSDLSDEEKDLILSNLDYSNKFYPDHDFISNRNFDLEINNAPFGVSEKNGMFVKNAWVSIFSFMPSVLYSGSLYVPEFTKLLTGFNYKVEIPPNYGSGGYPETSSGDCKRTYNKLSETAENKVYVNNQYRGSGDLVDLIITADSEIKTDYLVNVKVNVDHYHWNTYCCATKDGSCVRHCHRCKFDYSEVKEDNILLTDNFNVKKYEDNLTADVEIVDIYSDTNKLKLDYSNSIILTFKDSLFEFKEFVYDISYSKAPYYVYTLKAKDYGQEKIKNILKDEGLLLLNNVEECKIKAFDFFNGFTKGCSLEFNDFDLIIETDRLKYEPDEVIEVKITPSDILVTVSYGGETKEIVGETSFIAKPLKNKITAEYNFIKAEKIIFVTDKDRFSLIWALSLFGVLNYLIFCLLKKYWGQWT